MNAQNIMIVGVGGQGTLLASRILGNTLLAQGCDVKVSEVHGMSQRGGSVVTYVRCGEAVASPTVEHGCADTILAFELLEAKRALPFLKPGGRMLVNTRRIDPMPVIMGAAEYPADILDELHRLSDLTAIDASAIAKQAGNPRAVNVALIGLLAKTTEIPKEAWLDQLALVSPPAYLESNTKAFLLGYQAE